MRNIIQGLTWVFPLLIVLIGLTLSFVWFSEFYNIQFAGKKSAYAFGAGDNADSWVYQSAFHYSVYMFSFGFLYLLASILALIGILKLRQRLALISMSVIVLMLIYQLVA